SKYRSKKVLRLSPTRPLPGADPFALSAFFRSSSAGSCARAASRPKAREVRAQLSAAETAGDVLQAITHASCGLGNRALDGVEATSVFGEDVIAGDNGEA